MPEQVLNLRRDVFGELGRLKKSQIQVWWLLTKLMECEDPWTRLPSKLVADARVLVGCGIALEDERQWFCVNPEIAYLTEEPTMLELMNEAAE